MGFTPVGVDVRADNVAAPKKFGIEGHACDLESLALERPCGVISLADVLEHMPFPKRGLKAAHGLLADGGLALISMPNSETALWRVLSDSSTNPFGESSSTITISPAPGSTACSAKWASSP
ncbi:MAG: class I SAM-dependent methyltransferase [Rhodospirillaceae bacterium]